MKRVVGIWFVLSLLIVSYPSFGQNEAHTKPYWIFFTDKDTNDFNPYTFFDTKAIQRRLRNHVPLTAYDDIPVKSSYIEEISLLCDSIIYPSRWFNALYVYAQPNQIDQISKLPFVAGVEDAFSEITSQICMDSAMVQLADTIEFSRALKIMNGDEFYRRGFRGQGVRIAVFDAGFPGVDTLSVFHHLRKNKKIIATYDFRKKRDFVYSYNQHGTMVLQCIAGLSKDSTVLGLATEAEFLLARTEINSEILAEEIYWIAALEWADQHGADLVNSSLGYTHHRYFPAEMDGKTSLVSKAAQKAMSKGILVINAAGNDGNKRWHIVGAPADADSIISVGGVDPTTLLPTSFSSRGPTADGRIKPDVSSSGWVTVYTKSGKLADVAGTSFAAPLVTGFAACLLSSDTTMTSKTLYNKLRQSGHLYPYFDYANGFGIVNALKALGKSDLNKTYYTINITENDVLISFSETSDAPTSYFYAHQQSKNGILKWYDIKEVSPGMTIKYPKNQFSPGDIFRCFYQNQFYEHQF